MPAHWLPSERVIEALLANYHHVPFWNLICLSRNRVAIHSATDETFAKSGRSYGTNACKFVNRELDFS